jgi:hypothetical protein
MAQFMVVLFTIVNVALPSIQTGLHIGTSTLQWLTWGMHHSPFGENIYTERSWGAGTTPENSARLLPRLTPRPDPLLTGSRIGRLPG